MVIVICCGWHDGARSNIFKHQWANQKSPLTWAGVTSIKSLSIYLSINTQQGTKHFLFYHMVLCSVINIPDYNYGEYHWFWLCSKQLSPHLHDKIALTSYIIMHMLMLLQYLFQRCCVTLHGGSCYCIYCLYVLLSN